jgi:predicted PurR-regulated permease PerM
MNTRIDIDTKTFVRFWLVVIGFGLLILALNKAITAFIILGTSFFLALALNAPVSKLARLLPGKSRVGATALAYVAVIVLLGLIVTLVIPPIVQQTARFIQTAPAVIEGATSQYKGLRTIIETYNLQPQVDQALKSIQESSAAWAGNVGQGVVAGVGSFFSFVAALILVLVLTFLMLVEGPMWMKRIWAVYTDRERMQHHKHVTHRMYNVVTGYVTGQLTVSAIGATFAGLAVFVLSLVFPDLPGSLAFPTAAITFMLSLIPMFGATIGGVIITALIAFNSIPAAIAYLVYFVVYQQVENNFISPTIQAKKIELSALAVLASVTIGLYMFGVVGGIIAIPIAGSIRVLIDEYLKSAKRKREHQSRRQKTA